LQYDGEWTALYPVVMKLPSHLAAMSGSEKVKGLSNVAREALKISAERSNVTPREPAKDGRGVPQPTDGLYWSLSHSVDCVAAVVAPYTVGIDLEQIRDISPLLRDQVASEAEWQLAPDNDPTLFFRYWTAKEAVLKASGHGLSGLAGCSVSEIIDDVQIRLAYHGTNWLVVQHRIPEIKAMGLPGYIAAITSGRHDIIWQVIRMATSE
jgi:4'-phosphopantetheinyl transferase